MFRTLVNISIITTWLLFPSVSPFLCQSGTSLGKVMAPDNELNCIGALIERCSVVYTNNNGNEIWVHGCASSSNKCGTVVRDGQQYQNYCCCEEENCNDAAFAERCSLRTSIIPPLRTSITPPLRNYRSNGEKSAVANVVMVVLFVVVSRIVVGNVF